MVITLRQAFSRSVEKPNNLKEGGAPNWALVHADLARTAEHYCLQGFENLVFEWKRNNKRFG